MVFLLIQNLKALVICEIPCDLPSSDGSWYSPNFPFKYQTMSDKNIHNDCPDFETIFIKYTKEI